MSWLLIASGVVAGSVILFQLIRLGYLAIKTMQAEASGWLCWAVVVALYAFPLLGWLLPVLGWLLLQAVRQELSRRVSIGEATRIAKAEYAAKRDHPDGHARRGSPGQLT